MGLLIFSKMRLLFGCSLFYSILSSEIKFVDVSSQKSFSRTDKLSEKKSEKLKAKPEKEVEPFDILYPNTPQASVYISSISGKVGTANAKLYYETKVKDKNLEPADPEEIVQANISWKKSLTDGQKKFATKMASIK